MTFRRKFPSAYLCILESSGLPWIAEWPEFLLALRGISTSAIENFIFSKPTRPVRHRYDICIWRKLTILLSAAPQPYDFCLIRLPGIRLVDPSPSAVLSFTINLPLLAQMHDFSNVVVYPSRRHRLIHFHNFERYFLYFGKQRRQKYWKFSTVKTALISCQRLLRNNLSATASMIL